MVVECPLDEMNRPRASVDPQLRIPPAEDEIEQLFAGWREEHPALWPVVNRVRTAADGLDGGDFLVAMAEVKETHRLLVQVLLPHEAAEDTLLYPAVGRVLGGYDPTLPMSRTHAAIHHQVVPGNAATGVLAVDRRQAAPEVRGQLLGGTAYDLGSLRGTVTVVNFWGGVRLVG